MALISAAQHKDCYTRMTLFSILVLLMVYHRKLKVVPCAVQPGLVVYPPANTGLPAPLLPTPPLGNRQPLLSVCASVL